MVTRLSIDGRVVVTGSSGLVKAPSRILALLGMLFVSALFARGASTLNFPKLAFESDTFVGIAIVNPTGQEATVTLTAYDTAGRLVAGTGFVNPVVVTIKANQPGVSAARGARRLQDGARGDQSRSEFCDRDDHGV